MCQFQGISLEMCARIALKSLFFANSVLDPQAWFDSSGADIFLPFYLSCSCSEWIFLFFFFFCPGEQRLPEKKMVPRTIDGRVL